MSYLDAGFDNNLIRNIYPDYESLEDSSIIGEILTAGAIPTGEITNALVASGILNSDNALIADLISASLNTQSKEILGSFTFGASGALAIATDADNGLWISPTGILAKKAGENTVAITAGGDATFGGTLVAAAGTLGSITAGTITGATIQTATSGARVVIKNENGVQFYDSDTYKGKIIADATQGIIYDTAGSSHFFRSATTEYAQINSNGLLLPSNKAIRFTGGAAIIGYGGYVKIEGSSGGTQDLRVEGNVYPNSDNAHQCGTSDKRWQDVNSEDAHIDDIYIGDRIYSSDGSQGVDSSAKEFATSFRWNGSDLQWKARSITVKDGLIVDVGSESSWRTV